MTGPLWAFGAAIVIFAAVVSYVVTRRYGWGLAVLLPVLALATMIAMRWQAAGISVAEGMANLGPMLLFGSPVLLGSAVGIAVARIGRG
jgi:uncharacterized membrane protein